MADLVFFSGPMDCGKSTLALQLAHTQGGHGRRGRLFTCHDRSGRPVITSRIGLSADAVEVDPGLDFWLHLVDALTAGERIDFLVCDEAQFYTPAQIDQLARIVDDLEIDVFAFGILADFRTELFPGSRRLVELADRMETLQVQPLCWCGARATHNARVVDGVMVTEGDQVAVGDTDDDTQDDPGGDAVGQPAAGAHAVTYQVLCRRHHRQRMTLEAAQASPHPDPLPFQGEAPAS